MADQKKWFKVWASILVDPTHSDLNLADVGRWTRLGAYMVMCGEQGKMKIDPPAKAFLLAMDVESCADAKLVLKRLPNVQINDNKDDNGGFIVIMLNWHKYQMDSTGYERLKRSRYKRREEKRRKEEQNGVSLEESTSKPLAGPYGG